MKKLIALISCSIIFNVFAGDLSTGLVAKHEGKGLSEARIIYEHQKRIDNALAPVKTTQDLFEIASQGSPLDALSPDAKQRFIDSVVFTSKGVGSYHYQDLEAELTPTQIYKILSMIGSQHNISLFSNARIESDADILLLLSPKPSKDDHSNDDFTTQGGSAIGIGDDGGHKGYWCSSRATCSERQGSICTLNC
ncbi:hypothetical protein [Alteromonas macleodii]|jgi:hypothetical protein|uniref:hypothetical protein n=1 Tax=Alteromonas macleodii TaxID=28108 RepID=UPI0006907602|nr:hypothetical protein [Alteromonas macleodii]